MTRRSGLPTARKSPMPTTPGPSSGSTSRRVSPRKSALSITTSRCAGPERLPSAWSPDSKWVAYTLDDAASYDTVYVYSLEKDKSFAVTDGLSEASEPVFDTSGKYLYFFTSTDAGPVINWFDQSNADMRMTNSIYVAVLRKDIPSPLAKESDEEKVGAKGRKEGRKTQGSERAESRRQGQRAGEKGR